MPLPFPDGCPRSFRTTVHGTVFGGRERYLGGVHDGEAVRLVPDPPGQDGPGVWVHLGTGQPIGHLPPEIAEWLWPWLSGGGVAEARVLRVRGEEVPSYRRMVIEVACRTDA